MLEMTHRIKTTTYQLHYRSIPVVKGQLQYLQSAGEAKTSMVSFIDILISYQSLIL